MFFTRIIWPVCILICLGTTAANAGARTTQHSKHLMKIRDSQRYKVKTPKSSIQAGAARVTVRASAKTVQKTVLKFNRYSKWIHRFKKSKIVGKSGGKTDVYLEVPILKGLAKVWAVVRFDPPKHLGKDDVVIKGHLIKGNVKFLDVNWRITRLDDNNTQLDLSLLIVPDIPAPGSIVTGEVAYAADVAVIGIRERSEKITRKK